ncbi:hypothetical protein Tco_0786512 [Tanacetum coccineum]
MIPIHWFSHKVDGRSKLRGVVVFFATHLAAAVAVACCKIHGFNSSSLPMRYVWVRIRTLLQELAPETDFENTHVSNVMTRNPVFVLADTLAVKALQKMLQERAWLDNTSIVPVTYDFIAQQDNNQRTDMLLLFFILKAIKQSPLECFFLNTLTLQGRYLSIRVAEDLGNMYLSFHHVIIYVVEYEHVAMDSTLLVQNTSSSGYPAGLGRIQKNLFDRGKGRVGTKFGRSGGQVDLEWWPRLARCDYGEIGCSMERCIEVRGRLTKEVTRVLLGVQGGDGGGRVVAWW